jgi:putative inorganic carbon (hco3(-)) transporter
MLNVASPFFYLLAYIVVMFLRPQEYVPALMGSPLVPTLLLSAFGFWFVAQRKRFDAPQHLLLLGLAAAMFVSVLLADGFGSAVASLVDFVPTMMLFYMVATSVDSLSRLRQLALVLSVLAAVMALHGIKQFESENGVGWTGAKLIEGRITYLGFFNDPNDLSMAFLLILPLALGLVRRSEPALLRAVGLGCAALILYGTFLCNSRGSMLGIMAMLAMAGIRRYGWARTLTLLPLIFGPLLLLAPSRVNEMSADEESAAGRIDAWYEGFDMLRHHPLFGVGKGLFTDHNWLTAHNSFVLAIAELGMVGYFFWLSMLVFSVMMLKHLLGAAPGEPGDSGTALTPTTLTPTLDAPGQTLPAPDTEGPPVGPEWPDVQAAATTLAYSLLGTVVTAFFLSRSYVGIFYMLMAMIVALHTMARVRWPGMAAFHTGKTFGTLIGIELASVMLLWLLTRVLLQFQ